MLVVVIGSGVVGANDFKVAVVTDVSGLGDQSFNDAAYRGLLRAQEKLGIRPLVVESKKMDEYESNLRMLADQGYDLIFGIGFLLADAINRVAQEYPETYFGLINEVVKQPNVISITFKEHEGSFLQGVIAGMMTKSDVVGYVGGMETPIIIKYEVGFRAGVKAVNLAAKVLVGYTGKFDDPDKGKEKALTQIANGADVLYHAAGACGLGVIAAAREQGVLAIGVDSDQSSLAPNTVISSMVKMVDVGVFFGVKSLVEGNLQAGLMELGIKENGVGTVWSSVKIPATVMARVNEYTTKIASGQYKVPTTRLEL